MKRIIVKSSLIAAAILLSASPSLAVENKPATPEATNSVNAPRTTSKNAKSGTVKSATVKLVDINSASKAELKTLPGVTDATADKIIAGRPYNTKALLLTNNIVSRGEYLSIRKLVIAKQK